MHRHYPDYGWPGSPNLDPYYLSEREQAVLDAKAGIPEEVECKVCGGEGWMPWSETYRTRDGRTVDDFGHEKCDACGGLGVITL